MKRELIVDRGSTEVSTGRTLLVDRWGAPYSLAKNEQLHVLHVLSLTGGNVSHAARFLGIGLRTLQRKLGEWNVDRRDYVLRGKMKGEENA